MKVNLKYFKIKDSLKSVEKPGEAETFQKFTLR